MRCIRLAISLLFIPPAILCLCAGLSIHALPDEEAIRNFNAEIQKEIADFENELRATPPGPRTQEIVTFQQQRTEEKIAFEESLEGLSLQQQTEALEAFAIKRRRDLQEHTEKLKTLPLEGAKLQEKRKEFRKKLSAKIRDFYDQ